MKKVYTKLKYKKWHANSSEKKFRLRKKRENIKYDPYRSGFNLRISQKKKKFLIKSPISSPSYLSLINNSEETIHFFIKLRNNLHVSYENGSKYVSLDLYKIKNVDFSTLCVLNAIIEELALKKIFIRGNFPKDPNIKMIIEESGILNKMSDINGNKFPVSLKSDLLFIQAGSKKLTRAENIRLSKIIISAVKHLTGRENHCSQLRTILLEICGNSIEWGGTLNRGWLLGVKYNDEEVIFTVTDIGKGILNTIERKFSKIIKDIVNISSDIDILMNAFIRKYGSSSLDLNRNKGLPAIKKGFDDGLILDLKVITNNVILNFSQESDSKLLNKHRAFEGTLYRCVLTKDSLNKLKKNNENY